MSTKNTPRRTFLKVAGAGLVGAAVHSSAESYARILGANDKVRVGLVGSSDRARQALMPAFYKYADELNFDVAAVSDIWTLRREQAAEYFHKRFNRTRALARNR